MKKKVIIGIVLIVFILIFGVLILLRSNSKEPEAPDYEVEAEEAPTEKPVPDERSSELESEKPDDKKAAEEKSENWLDEDFPQETPDPNIPPVIVDSDSSQKPQTDFDAYINMSADEQRAFYESFESPDAFFEWYNAAKAEHDKNSGDIILDGNTNIEIKG